MGQEQEYVLEAAAKSNELTEVANRLKAMGWKDVNFGFQLGRKTGALDFISNEQRYLIYTSDRDERENYLKLLKSAIPVFETKYQPNGIAVARIQANARALDSLNFPDEGPTTGYLGSLNILDAVAKISALIYKRTAKALPHLSLDALALAAGEKDIIRLIPPLHLEPIAKLFPDVKESSLVETHLLNRFKDHLSEDLKLQDPQNPHERQIAFFKDQLRIYLQS